MEQIVTTTTEEPQALLEFVDLLRLDANSQLDAPHQAQYGQFFTSSTVAKIMAGLFDAAGTCIRLLDAGAGVGSLTAAFVDEICTREVRPQMIRTTAYEADGLLLPYLKTTLRACQERCQEAGITFEFEIRHEDFVTAAVKLLPGGLFSKGESFDCAILNPPYRKIQSTSHWRGALSAAGIETSNLYSAFVWLTMRLLESGGELVAITPRSFCNGPYFKSFRLELTKTMNLRHFHLFESRIEAFKDNAVLQENIIFHAGKKMAPSETESTVTISASMGPNDEGASSFTVPLEQIVRPGDADVFINLVTNTHGQHVAELATALSSSLSRIGIGVSTGRVVDFRVKDSLRSSVEEKPDEAMAPLIYPLHFAEGFISWPKDGGRKPNALAITSATLSQLNTRGIYVLVKRFSSKEQTRRIVASLYDPERDAQRGQDTTLVGFENHLNYFHERGHGLPRRFAIGLTAFLNSTLVDSYFRQFNGHTQVNATDLRSLKYPTRAQLEHLGSQIEARFHGVFPSQTQLDSLLTEEIFCYGR